MTRGRAAAAMAAAIVLVAGTVAARSSRTESAVQPAAPDVAEVAYPNEGPGDSLVYEVPSEPKVADVDAGTAERSSAGIVDDGAAMQDAAAWEAAATREAAAAREAAASGKRSGRDRLARAPKLRINMKALDEAVSERAATATTTPIVTLPAITGARELPQVDGRRVGGPTPR